MNSFSDFFGFEKHEQDYFTSKIDSLKFTQYQDMFDEKFDVQKKLFSTFLEQKFEKEFSSYFKEQKDKINLHIRNKKRDLYNFLSDFEKEYLDESETKLILSLLDNNKKLLEQNNSLLTINNLLKKSLEDIDAKIIKMEFQLSNFEVEKKEVSTYFKEKEKILFSRMENREISSQENEIKIENLKARFSEIEMALKKYSEETTVLQTTLKSNIFKAISDFAQKYIYTKIDHVEAGVSEKISDNSRKYNNTIREIQAELAVIQKKEKEKGEEGEKITIRNDTNGPKIIKPVEVFEDEEEEEEYHYALKLLNENEIEINDYSIENVHRLAVMNKGKILSAYQLKQLDNLLLSYHDD